MCDVQDSIFVTTLPKAVNNNNLEKFSPFSIVNEDGSPYIEKEKPKVKGPVCKKCGRKFETYSKREIHNAKPCEPPPPDPDAPKVRVCFSEQQIPYLQEFADATNMEIQKEEGSGILYFTIFENELKHLLKQLYYAQTSIYNIEVWYHKVVEIGKVLGETLTAHSQFIELDDADLKLIQKMFTHNRFGAADTISRKDNRALGILERKVMNCMKEGCEYFCRLSTRSPKDGGKTKKEDLELKAEERLASKNVSLKITSAHQVVELLTRSQRVFADISNYFQYRTPNTTSYKMNLILRDWITDLSPSLEFRCYAHDGALTCISQYNCYDVFGALQEKEFVLRIRDQIKVFHEKVKDAFPMPSYVFDVALLGDDLSQMQIIELNPFGAHMSSGSGLYNWETDYDLFYSRSEETNIRVLSELLSEE